MDCDAVEHKGQVSPQVNSLTEANAVSLKLASFWP